MSEAAPSPSATHISIRRQTDRNTTQNKEEQTDKQKQKQRSATINLSPVAQRPQTVSDAAAAAAGDAGAVATDSAA